MKPVLLDSNGLSHFWSRMKELYWIGTTEEFASLETTLREGTIVHLTDDDGEVNYYVVSVSQDEDGNLVFLMSDGTEITIGNTGSYHSGTLFEGTIGTSQYTSTVKYVRDGAVVTIYFDLEGDYTYDNFYFDNLLPEDFRPSSRVTSLVVESMNNFNNIIIDTNGRVGCTSNTSNYNIKTAVTYVLMAASVEEDSGQ